jgi:Guanylate-binding protein, C-terminal domain
MADDQLRTEFVQQVNYLRAKIYKKVKPKTLNSKYITGEMLLELCYAYTTAINTGSVPNIQNAWSYVCQNECQRAIQESINSYENSMRNVLQNAKEKCDEQLIKSEHRPSRDLSVNIFKQKAVG